MFIKMWLEVKHSTASNYFALWLIEANVFPIRQLHKHFSFRKKVGSPTS